MFLIHLVSFCFVNQIDSKTYCFENGLCEASLIKSSHLYLQVHLYIVYALDLVWDTFKLITAISLWHSCGVIEAELCYDSGLQLICIFGAGWSHLPLDSISQIHYGVQVRRVGRPIKHSNTMVY